ncbi:hypothetical protein [Enterococcus sp. BWR-S5]|uniref:hypothetical protein n=1 Tax=Enterococcus sp. BWR-S5 TaxID=2787714 RepID=UPI0019240183|nr:hypothetical protein [Enterococcus sp. BWR-S5]MBL1226679.1 hypothetical protein [Enterococcus sp. BWR-S5]
MKIVEILVIPAFLLIAFLKNGQNAIFTCHYSLIFLIFFRIKKIYFLINILTKAVISIRLTNIPNIFIRFFLFDREIGKIDEILIEFDTIKLPCKIIGFQLTNAISKYKKPTRAICESVSFCIESNYIDIALVTLTIVSNAN